MIHKRPFSLLYACLLSIVIYPSCQNHKPDHLDTGILELRLKNLPPQTSSITFATDRVIGGHSSQCSDIPIDKERITDGECTLEINLPAGEYKAFAIDLKDAGGGIIKSDNRLVSLDILPGLLTADSTDFECSKTVVDFPRTGLPSIVIVTPDRIGVTSKTEWIDNALYAIRTEDGYIDSFGLTSIKGRGNTSWALSKKPYNIRLYKSSRVLGMSEGRRWCLLANYLDRTLMRNAVAFEIAHRCPGLKWTPSGEFVEMIQNGEHLGNYYLCEQIRDSRNRLDIRHGYILELDKYYDEKYKFHSKLKKIPYQIKNKDHLSKIQLYGLKWYVWKMEKSLFDDRFFSKRDYLKYLDLPSWIDFWFVNELSSNSELRWPKSLYMTKELNVKGGGLMAGPVWDFDFTTFVPIFESEMVAENDYYARLMEDPSFRSEVKKRWMAERKEFEDIPHTIDSLKERLALSDAINHSMWPIIYKKIVNYDEHLSFDEAVEQLKQSYINKFNYMDKEILSW